MASMHCEPSHPDGLGKRKREDDDDEDTKENIFLSGDEGFDETNVSSANEADHISDDGSFDEGESEGNEDEDDEEPAYHESMEEYPLEPAYDPEVDQIIDNCIGMAAEIEQVFIESNCNSDRVRNFLEKAAEFRNFPVPEPIKIGMLGATGVGKSATTSAVIDVPNLAKEGASGQACTCVATELRAQFPLQEKSLAAKVSYIDKVDIRGLFKELLENYMHMKLKEKAKWSVEDTNLFEERAKTAVSTFRALFNNREEFTSEQSTIQFLDRQKSSIEKAADTMASWCHAVLDAEKQNDDDNEENTELEERPQGDLCRRKYIQTDRAKDFRNLLDPLMCSKATYREPSFWPLVQQVSIGMRGPRVLTNMSIADLPGVTDTNKLRVKATTTYLEACDGLWIVARMDRVVSDPTVSTLVYTLLEKYGERFAGRVAIICTRSDDFDLYGEAKNLHDEDYDLGDFFSQYKTYKRLDKEAKKLNKDLEKATKPNKRVQQTTIDSLSKAKLDKDAELNDLHTKLYNSIALVRNQSITNQLREKYKEHIPEGCMLQVFCISNRHYIAAKGVTSLPAPVLKVQNTSIPELRSYALSIAAPAVFENFESYVHGFRIFSQGLEMWANGKTVVSTADLREIVLRPQQEFPAKLEGFHHKLNKLAEERIMKCYNQKLTDMSDAAYKEIQTWRSMHWCTIRAFIDNDGMPKKSLASTKTWNRDLHKFAIDKILKPAWDALRDTRKEFFSSLAGEFERGLAKVIEDLSKMPDAQSLPLRQFSQMVREHRWNLSNAFAKYQRKYNKALKNIRLNALSSGEDGYFAKEMAQCYDQCRAISGTGYKNNVLKCFEIHVALASDKSPFYAAGKAITKDVKLATNQCYKNMLRAADNTTKDILDNFDNMTNNNEHDPTEDSVKQAIAAYLETKKEQIESTPEAIDNLVAKYQKMTVEYED